MSINNSVLQPVGQMSLILNVHVVSNVRLFFLVDESTEIANMKTLMFLAYVTKKNMTTSHNAILNMLIMNNQCIDC